MASLFFNTIINPVRSAILAGVLLSALLCSASFAGLTPSLEQWLLWEQRSNQASNSIRPTQKVMLEHFEIPLSEVESLLDSQIDPKLKKSLVFKKNSKDYVRWIVNPEDTQYGHLLAIYLQSKNLDSHRYRYYEAYYTASRSMVIQDPVSGVVFSAKVGTDKTGGEWQDKQLTAKRAEQAAKVDQWIDGFNKNMKLKNAVLMREPASFFIKELKQGMIIRSLETMTKKGSYHYLPGFSVLTNTAGVEIAKKNGSLDPAAFWLEHAVKPIARAQAEWSAFSGILPSSFHWQNYILELDEHYRPTGKVLLRDYADGKLVQDFHESLTPQNNLISVWPEKEIIGDLNDSQNAFEVYAGPLWGIKSKPDWLTDSVAKRDLEGVFLNYEPTLPYATWKKTYLDEFELAFSKIAGLTSESWISQQEQSLIADKRTYYHFAGNSEWLRYLRNAECLRGSSVNSYGEPCPQVLSQALTEHYLKPPCQNFVRHQ